MSYELLALLFLIAMLAGFIDSIAGGGGLLTVPALLAVGLPPASALATNKLQSCGGSFSASLYFIRQRMVDLKQQKWAIILTISVGLYFLLSPTIGENDRKSRLTILQFAILPALVIGFYDGFFGPGAGSFYAVAYITLAGFNLTKATAHTKVLNFTSNLAGLIFFIAGGEVVWSIGLVMLVGQFIGARLGAKMVIAKGRKLIRPMLITVSTIMSIKLIYENFF